MPALTPNVAGTAAIVPVIHRVQQVGYSLHSQVTVFVTKCVILLDATGTVGIVAVTQSV